MAKRLAQTELTLVRSGRTEWEEGGRLQGRSDLPLCAHAQANLDAMIAQLAGPDGKPDVDVVLHGPDEASAATAVRLGEVTGARVRAVKNLRAFDLGLWEGLLEEDLLERYPSAFKQWRDDPASVRPPEGELFSDAEARLLGALGRSVEKHAGRSIAAVLRPLEFGILRLKLEGQATKQMRELLCSDTVSSRHVVTPETFKSLAEAMKAGA
jgi:broad specificity phosphatase PhoE